MLLQTLLYFKTVVINHQVMIRYLQGIRPTSFKEN